MDDKFPLPASLSVDPFFVPERRARNPMAQMLLASIEHELDTWEERNRTRKRRHRKPDQLAHERVVEAIVCEAVRRHLMQPDGAVAISLGKDHG